MQTYVLQWFRISSHRRIGFPREGFPQLSTSISLHNMYYAHLLATNRARHWRLRDIALLRYCPHCQQYKPGEPTWGPARFMTSA